MLSYNTGSRGQSQVRNFKKATAPSGATIGDLWVDISTSPPSYKTLISQYPDVWAAISTSGGGGGGIATPPSGNNKEVQFNNDGAFAGAANVEIDNGDLTLTVNASPVTPPTDNVKLFSKNVGNARSLIHAAEPTGVSYPVQPSIWRKSVARWNPPGNTTAVPGVDGIPALTASPAGSTRNTSTTNTLSRARRLGYTTITTAGSVACAYAAFGVYALGNGNGLGGFFYACKFGVSDSVLQTVGRSFVGLSSAITAQTNVDPATLTNVIGVGTNGDSNWFIYYGGSASQTRIDLGADFPINTTDLMELVLYSPPNQNGVVHYEVTRYTNTGKFVAVGTLGPGTAGTTLPANTTLLSHRAWRSNNTAAASVGIDVAHIYIESDW